MEQRISTLYLLPILFDRYKKARPHKGVISFNLWVKRVGKNESEKGRRLQSTYSIITYVFLQNGHPDPTLCSLGQVFPQNPEDVSCHVRPVLWSVVCPRHSVLPEARDSDLRPQLTHSPVGRR